MAAALNLGAAGMNISNTLITSVDPPGADNLRTVAATVAGNATISGPVFVNGGVVFSAVPGATINVTGAIQDGADTSASTRHFLHVAGGGTVVLSNSVNLPGRQHGNQHHLGRCRNSGPDQHRVAVVGPHQRLHRRRPYRWRHIVRAPKIYTQGQVKIAGNTSTTSVLPLSLGTLTIDSGGSFAVGHSAATSSPVFVNVGPLDFIGTPSNGQIDLTNNQLLTTNDANTVRQQLQFANIVTTTPGGTLAYHDTGDGHTHIFFDLGGDADLNFHVDSSDS